MWMHVIRFILQHPSWREHFVLLQPKTEQLESCHITVSGDTHCLNAGYAAAYLLPSLLITACSSCFRTAFSRQPALDESVQSRKIHRKCNLDILNTPPETKKCCDSGNDLYRISKEHVV